MTPTALRDYALVADGQRGALIGPRGDVVWMCFPVWHDPAVFAALLGSGGSFTVRPNDPYVWGGTYQAGSLVWRSRWVSGDVLIESREALALPAERERAVLLRQISAVGGEATVDVELQPALDYGRDRAGTWSGRGDVRTWTASGGAVAFRLSGVPAARIRDGVLRTRLRLAAGSRHDLVLEVFKPGSSHERVDPDQCWEDTCNEWRTMDVECPDPAASRDVRHAFAVIRGLTAPSGGTVAAATASLPERADTGSSYDYRYVWIRDLCYIGAAAAAAGAAAYVRPAVRFVTDRLVADGDGLMPAYTIDGDAVPPPTRLGIPGYPGGSDIVGNHVRDQFQLDGFGEALRLIAAADELEGIDALAWTAAEIAAAAIERRWEEPDHGIWEIGPEAWTHSRLIGAAGLRAIAARPGAARWRAAWLATADQIVAATAATSTYETGRWRRSPTDDRVDASLLLPGIRAAVPVDDPRHVATIRAVHEELCADGYVYRFRHQAGRPLGDAEGAFLLCSFWMCLAALGQGDRVEAARWFERARAGCGSPGLFSEEFDVEERQLRGNLPQAFVHALLIESAYAMVTS